MLDFTVKYFVGNLINARISFRRLLRYSEDIRVWFTGS